MTAWVQAVRKIEYMFFLSRYPNQVAPQKQHHFPTYFGFKLFSLIQQAFIEYPLYMKHGSGCHSNWTATPALQEFTIWEKRDAY